MANIIIDARIIKSSTGRYAERLLHYLQRIDRTNHYLILVRKKRDFKPSSPNFQVMDTNIKDFSLKEQLALNSMLKRFKPDLVHFPMPQHPVLYKGKFVSTIHDLTMITHPPVKGVPLIYWVKLFIFKMVMKHAIKHSRAVITPSNYVKRQILKRYKPKHGKVNVIHEAADLLEQSPKPVAKLAGKKFLLYVGNAFPYKNLDNLVAAFRLLRESHPELILILAGRKERFYKKLEARVKKAKVKNVVFAGYVPDSQLVWLYQNTACFVFPSLSEGFGLPGLEAMLYGAPVAASRKTALPEVYGDAAEYFNPKYPNSIAVAIDKVLSSASRRQKLVREGRNRAREYSWRLMAEQTLEIYEKAVEEQKKSATKQK